VDNPLKRLWINTGFSTPTGNHTTLSCISTALHGENKQVFHRLMTEKHINLLILQQVMNFVDKLHHALTVSRKI